MRPPKDELVVKLGALCTSAWAKMEYVAVNDRVTRNQSWMKAYLRLAVAQPERESFTMVEVMEEVENA